MEDHCAHSFAYHLWLVSLTTSGLGGCKRGSGRPQGLYSLASYRTRFLIPILEDGSSRKLSLAPWDVLGDPHQAPAALALLSLLQASPLSYRLTPLNPELQAPHTDPAHQSTEKQVCRMNQQASECFAAGLQSLIKPLNRAGLPSGSRHLTGESAQQHCVSGTDREQERPKNEPAQQTKEPQICPGGVTAPRPNAGEKRRDFTDRWGSDSPKLGLRLSIFLMLPM